MSKLLQLAIAIRLKKKDEILHRIYSSDEKLINNILDSRFGPWFGTYHAYFASTSSVETDRIFTGSFEVLEESSDGICHVKFEFQATPEHKKEYTGTLTLSSQAAYCTLEDSTSEGEISYLLFSNPDLKSTVDVSCCIGLVLTYSSGKGTRRPCCERILISRKSVDEDSELYEMVTSQLLLNNKCIYISEESYNGFIEEIGEQSDDALQKFKQWYPTIESLPNTHVRVNKYVEITESWILGLQMNAFDTWKIVCKLRNRSISKRYTKVKADSENKIFYLLNRKSE